MDLGIEGRAAIVCASSQGLGEACARALRLLELLLQRGLLCRRLLLCLRRTATRMLQPLLRLLHRVLHERRGRALGWTPLGEVRGMAWAGSPWAEVEVAPLEVSCYQQRWWLTARQMDYGRLELELTLLY